MDGAWPPVHPTLSRGPDAVFCLLGASGPHGGAGKSLYLQVQVTHPFLHLHLCGQRVQWPSDSYCTPPPSFAFFRAEWCVFCCPHDALGHGLGGKYSSPSPLRRDLPPVYAMPLISATAVPGTPANAHTDEHSRRGEEERITVTNISPRRRHGRKLGVLGARVSRAPIG